MIQGGAHCIQSCVLYHLRLILYYYDMYYCKHYKYRNTPRHWIDASIAKQVEGYKEENGVGLEFSDLTGFHLFSCSNPPPHLDKSQKQRPSQQTAARAVWMAAGWQHV